MRIVFLGNFFIVFLAHAIAADREQRPGAGFARVGVQIFEQLQIAHAAVNKDNVVLLHAHDLGDQAIGDGFGVISRGLLRCF